MAQYSLPVTINAGESVSGAVQASSRIAQIFMPPDWNTAPLSFEISLNGVDFYPLYNVQIITGGYNPYLVTVAVVPNAAYVLPAASGHSISNIKLRSGTRLQPIAQAEDRTFQILFDAA